MGFIGLVKDNRPIPNALVVLALTAGLISGVVTAHAAPLIDETFSNAVIGSYPGAFVPGTSVFLDGPGEISGNGYCGSPSAKCLVTESPFQAFYIQTVGDRYIYTIDVVDSVNGGESTFITNADGATGMETVGNSPLIVSLPYVATTSIGEITLGPDGGDALTVLNFEVTADPVPEPAIWSMFLIGFVLIGAVFRRRANLIGVDF